LPVRCTIEFSPDIIITKKKQLTEYRESPHHRETRIYPRTLQPETKPPNQRTTSANTQKNAEDLLSNVTHKKKYQKINKSRNQKD
jgi:hypothetical protein